jgi:hypothetical protein
MIEVKKGETLEVQCVYQVNGVAASLSGVSVRSQVRSDAGGLISELAVVPGQNTGEFTLTADTTTWPVGVHKWDVKYTSAGKTTFTDTVDLSVVEAVTR